jgi:hypothetical protein
LAEAVTNAVALRLFSTETRSSTAEPLCPLWSLTRQWIEIICYHPTMIASAQEAAIGERVAGLAGLHLLILFGSRARGDQRDVSDWDFGYLGSTTLDPDALLTALVDATGTDRIDLVDLSRAGGQLRYRAARDGRAIAAVDPDQFRTFWFDAVSYWCDMEPVLRTGYEAVLSRLDR